MNSLKEMQTKDYFGGGSPVCAGCPGSLALKLALKSLGKNTIVVNASGCMTLLSVYPNSPLKVSWMHNAIENAPATASAIKTVLPEKNVLVFAGDGATFDIGFQSLSASASRNDNLIYLCYNNQSYGNTGVQWCSATPLYAETKTTPDGNITPPKDMVKIMADHGVYSATASLAFPIDFMNKIEKAKAREGFSYIELLASCPTGWKFDSSKTIEVSKIAVDTGFWPLYEIENNEITINHKPKQLKSITEFLKLQGRYGEISKREIIKLQEYVSNKYHKLLKEAQNG